MSLAWLFVQKHWRPVALVAAVLLVAGGVAFCRPRDNPLPARDARTADSLAITAPMFQAQRTALVLHETTYVASAARAELHAATSTAAAHRLATVADSLRRLADSAQVAAVANGDTSSAWKDAALYRLAEADSLRGSNASLRTANDSLRSAVSSERSARLAADARDSITLARNEAVTGLNERLQGDVRRGDGCRILWVARCPTRTQAVIGGALSGIAAGYLLHRP